MILIEEKPSKKLPNLTSLFVTIPQNLTLLSILKQQPIYFNKNFDFELPINRLFYLINLFNKYDDTTFKPFIINKVIQRDCSKMHFKIKPYDYQIDGINYGLNHNGWLLLDDQGLGKTLQMIYLAESLYKMDKIKHCMIICGVNGLKYNWANEIKKFSNLSYTILGQKTNKKGKQYIVSVKERCEILKNPIEEFFIITNIETLQYKNFAKIFNNSKNSFGMIVLDEAHKAKNPSSKSAKNLLKLKSPHNIALTGTLIMNNPENAYIALKWTGNLNCTYSMFNAMYNIYGGFNNVQVIGYKNLDLLKEHIASCSLRRLKNDVLDLPEKTYQIEYVEMGMQQQALYDEVAKGIAAELDLLPNKKLTIIEELTINMRLRQITAWPGILSSEITQSAKLDRLEDLVENITSQGDKIIVFCTFKATIPEIERRLKKYNTVTCTGDTSDEQIDANKLKFEKDINTKVMICTWQKMGTGHTMVTANYAIFIDTPWTDADFKQTADRIYRIGQNKHTFIITLITKDTYDERVQEIIDNKETISGYLIDNKESNNLNQLIDY